MTWEDEPASETRPKEGNRTSARSTHNGVNENLDGVLVGKEVNDLEGVGDDADGHELLSVVASLHHERVDEALDNLASERRVSGAFVHSL